MGGSKNLRIAITSGLRGYFAVMVDDDGPVQSGIGSYSTPAGAVTEAREWARSEGIPFEGEQHDRR